MHTNFEKNIKHIFHSLKKVNKFPKTMMKYGFIAFVALLTAGTLMLVINRIRPNFDPHFDYSATLFIKNSFVVLAEIVIGGLIMDFVFKKE